MELPVFDLMVSPDENDEHEVNAVAFVDAPAIERNFFAFKDQRISLAFSEINDDERVVIGPAMIPDMPIYRRDDENGEYYVKFSKETIKTIAEKFFAKDYHKSANVMHESDKPLEGVVFFQSFIKDSSKGIQGMMGDYPEGTWFLGSKIYNEALWADIKSGKYKGYSVEGLFKYRPQRVSPKEAYEAIMRILQQVNCTD